ncbi:DUF1761 domain-containing protein [Jiella sp. MQZ9-1]|uniref:DUF1761 domain-containing protein n=1 Tax=Jiella flava TaxID=2816857 RepID=A0A939G2A5_9HYPH|nr:DUF1761 domain-containing protein [Jiella flava]MBO0664258.1 DUF1761 domain-containing protein [Jiella flava]MCD2472819.1 DUF1761 domain-containing protein [Jiella flava]
MGLADAANPVPSLIAALLAFGFGFFWHKLFEKPWMTAPGYEGEPGLKFAPLLIVFIAYFVIAEMLAGVSAHIGGITLQNTLLNALIVWAGFILAPMVVDHSFEARPRKQTLINGGHWLGVFIIMGVVIGTWG